LIEGIAVLGGFGHRRARRIWAPPCSADLGAAEDAPAKPS